MLIIPALSLFLASTNAQGIGLQETRLKAEKGDALSQLYLGVMYGLGKGVERDYAEAAKWYRKAAEQGDALAQFSLGEMYRLGKGVEKDYAEAYAWLNLAANRHETAGKTRDALEKRMSQQQVADAQKRTKELKRLIEEKQKSTNAAIRVPARP